jgi:hypothetical protein
MGELSITLQAPFHNFGTIFLTSKASNVLASLGLIKWVHLTFEEGEA